MNLKKILSVGALSVAVGCNGVGEKRDYSLKRDEVLYIGEMEKEREQEREYGGVREEYKVSPLIKFKF